MTSSQGFAKRSPGAWRLHSWPNRWTWTLSLKRFKQPSTKLVELSQALHLGHGRQPLLRRGAPLAALLAPLRVTGHSRGFWERCQFSSKTCLYRVTSEERHVITTSSRVV